MHIILKNKNNKKKNNLTNVHKAQLTLLQKVCYDLYSLSQRVYSFGLYVI